MQNEQKNAILNKYETFWERTNTDRCILHFTYLKPDPNPYKAPESLEQQWLDEEYVLNRFKHFVEHSGNLAEGVPSQYINIGPGCLAACIGGSFELAPNTVWFGGDPIVTDWENPPAIEFNENSEMWQSIVRIQNKFASDPEADFSITDLGGIMDIVASLRSTEALLYDLYDYPDEIKAFSARVKELWLKAFDKQVEIVRNANRPFNNWINIPSTKPWYPLQCDFSYMLSPAHFEEFVLPDLVDQVNHMERSIYHLDGVGELPHLDMLLDIPGLSGIQWVAGAGQPPLSDQAWFDLYRKIQDKKKNLVLMDALDENDMDRAERLIKSVDPVGMYISNTFSCREKAENMLEKIIQWSK